MKYFIEGVSRGLGVICAVFTICTIIGVLLGWTIAITYLVFNMFV